jgi:hypothetical protein
LATEVPPREHETGASRFRLAVPDYSLSLALVASGALLLAIAVRFLIAREVATPWIMGDELIYSEMAKSFAETGDFLFRDSPSHLNNVVYPALIAPAWFAQSIEDAYGLARLINSALMVLAVVPVYLWGKRLMPTAYALLAVVFVLLMPQLLYTGMLMSENAFFPAVVTSCFLIALTLERPTLLHQGLALAAIGATFAVRPQGIVLLGIYAVALVLKLAFDLRAPGGPRSVRYVLAELRRLLPTALTLLLLAAGYVALKASQGLPLETGLGSYGGVVQVEYDLTQVRLWVEDHFAEMALAVGLFPLSALIVLFGLAVRGWASSAAERAFVAVATSAFVVMVIQVGIYASRFSLRIEERNMFTVAAVLFLAFALWLSRGLPRPLVLTAVAALVPAGLLFSLDLATLLNIGILSDTFTLVPLLRLSSLIDGGVERVELLLRAGGFAAALAFALVPRRIGTAVLPAAVAVFLVLCSYSVFGSIRDHARATLALLEAPDPSWIDKRIGADSKAAFLYGGTAELFGEAQLMWQIEFWNRSVETIYNLGPPDPVAQLGAGTSFDALTGRIVPAAEAPSPPGDYVVAPNTLTLVGTRLAQQGRFVLYRMQPPLRLATYVGGIYGDSWMGSLAALTHYARPRQPGRLRVRVSREGWSGPSRPGKVTITVGRLGDVDGAPGISEVTASRTWTVRSGAVRNFTLPTPRFPYRLEIRVEPTFSPATYGHGDTRDLGAQIQLEPASS